jgi:hypothetical protein
LALDEQHTPADGVHSACTAQTTQAQQDMRSGTATAAPHVAAEQQQLVSWDRQQREIKGWYYMNDTLPAQHNSCTTQQLHNTTAAQHNSCTTQQRTNQEQQKALWHCRHG